jgi:hypothetical protein
MHISQGTAQTNGGQKTLMQARQESFAGPVMNDSGVGGCWCTDLHAEGRLVTCADTPQA